ncbi:MAG: bifunctional phosphopantothenoylcysteine decarboxylase/phosphopantothenate--cysteine ligase CoaBC [Candidatus Caenarcaniphilales bacterium]|nr:bifunctional phosphopantothenoylcysteine decarboxylase/phosphopantothenate--cysteine ligase CoaBC [Candidatus Caenarcaniphilales bacterium]
MPLKNKNIVLAISGGIAAYKSVELVSMLKKHGANVYCVLSESAENFVAPLSLEVISKNKVYTKADKHTINADKSYIDHIELANIADLILIAPATANTISKLACGISDDLIFDIILASSAPVIIAPAMNTKMWNHKAIQNNIKFIVDELDYYIIPPSTGELACGIKGIGRLAELQDIITYLENFIDLQEKLIIEEVVVKSQELTGKNIIISSGGTREYLDPVRFIGNSSSGEMGFALVQEAIYRNANVILVTTVNYSEDPIKAALIEHPNLVILQVNSADEMHKAIAANFNESIDALIMAAAVSDFSPVKYSDNKIKKDPEGSETITVELKKNPDIIKTIAETKQNYQIIIGFSLETENLLENARKKLIDKKLDIIVANKQDALGKAQSQISIIYTKPDNIDEVEINSLPLQHKLENAKEILTHLQRMLKANNEKNSNITSR